MLDTHVIYKSCSPQCSICLFVCYKKNFFDILYEKRNETMRPIWGCPPWWLVSLSRFHLIIRLECCYNIHNKEKMYYSWLRLLIFNSI